MTKQKSRPTRWAEAVSKAQDARAALVEIREGVEGKLDEAWDAFLAQIDEIASEAQAAYNEGASELRDAMSDLNDVREEYCDWLNNLPDNMQSSPVAEKLQTIDDMDFEIEVPDDLEITHPDKPDWEVSEMDLDDIESTLAEAENADLPRGFGRD